MNDLSSASRSISFVVAVAPFKAVYASERKRRENNKRVMLLFVEMRDTMAVVLQCVPRVDGKALGQTHSLMYHIESTTSKTSIPPSLTARPSEVVCKVC